MVGMMFIFPLSFAYAVVKHRVLEIPVLLRRSARYLLVRRGLAVLVVLLAVVANAAFTLSFSHLFRMNVHAAMAIGVGFGLFLAAISASPLKRTTDRIDRAFFRSAYDARQILERLAESIRTANDHGQVSLLLAGEISEALQPSFVTVYFANHDGAFEPQDAQRSVQAGLISPDLPLLQELRRRGRPMEIAEIANDGGDVGLLDRNMHPPECLVPLLARDGTMLGLIALGLPLSEEPYSGDDKRLLASVASQAGVAVESMALAEKMAERLDVERRSAQEMEIARQVQARLFPQKFPPLATLEYAGKCIQTRQVGGDYYDFLGLGSGQVGFVLADIAGKGISGALLMANLQANLRSQYATAVDDLPGLLESVNRLFFDNSTEEAYATLFFAAYDDASRHLRYANCGHLPALLRRADGTVERLSSTSTVLGLFQNWICCVAETQLQRGDILLLYTDGVTEASNAAGEDFGFTRLVDVLGGFSAHPIAEMMDGVIAAVLKFSDGVQADDITLVVARCR
jgi:serine phosphatase RsbU (regulator of sigma subunit)